MPFKKTYTIELCIYCDGSYDECECKDVCKTCDTIYILLLESKKERDQINKQIPKGNAYRPVLQCSYEKCYGKVDIEWLCGTCHYYKCTECLQSKGKTHDISHICKKADIETAKLMLARRKLNKEITNLELILDNCCIKINCIQTLKN